MNILHSSSVQVKEILGNFTTFTTSNQTEKSRVQVACCVALEVVLRDDSVECVQKKKTSLIKKIQQPLICKQSFTRSSVSEESNIRWAVIRRRVFEDASVCSVKFTWHKSSLGYTFEVAFDLSHRGFFLFQTNTPGSMVKHVFT